MTSGWRAFFGQTLACGLVTLVGCALESGEPCCANDLDCADGARCFEDRCALRCDDDAQCNEGELCAEPAGVCSKVSVDGESAHDARCDEEIAP